jgi:thiol-disulfide isomerase/thioredoxin
MKTHLARIGGGALGVAALALLTPSIAISTRGSRPEVSLWDTSMKPQKLSQYRGKVVILNFWATWCGPCKKELPMLAMEEKRYEDRGVVVIAASLDDATTVKRVRPFAKKEKLDFPVWVGATVDDLEKLGLGKAIPATAFFDKDGNLVGRVLGELQQDDVEHRIEWLLGNRQGGPPTPLVNNLGPQ